MDGAHSARHLERIREQGYTILEGAIDPTLTDSIRDRVREIERETLPAEETGSPVDGSSQPRTEGLLCLDPLFQLVPIHPEVLPVVEGLLDPACLLTTFSAIDVLPG